MKRELDAGFLYHHVSPWPCPLYVFVAAVGREHELGVTNSPTRHQQVTHKITHRQVKRPPRFGAFCRQPNEPLVEIYLLPCQRRRLPPAETSEQEQEQIVPAHGRQLIHSRVPFFELVRRDGTAARCNLVPLILAKANRIAWHGLVAAVLEL